MKKILATLLFSLFFLVAAAQVPAVDSRIVYEGRTFVENESVSFDWSGTTVRIHFSGRSLSMKASGTKTCYFNVWVDEEPSAKHQSVLEVKDGGEYTICQKLKKGDHSVVLQKRQEGEYGACRIESFETDGELLQAGEPFSRKIEFIGDSYTCGFGTEGADRNTPFKAEEENCNLTYAAIIGRYFDASVRHIAHSGRGIARNYNGADKENTMPVRYTRTMCERPDLQWSPAESGYKPDIVVIYLGTNDFSVGLQPTMDRWCEEYLKLLREVRAYYGENVPILCVASKANELMGDYVEEVVRRFGDKNVSWTSIQKDAHNDTTELGSAWHPNYAGHRKIALCMIPYISTLTGWDLPLKTIE